MKKLTIKGQYPAGLSICRDDAGVPHIKADHLNDISWGIGYCHAVDRASQMLSLRIIGQGRLCELLSDNEESLAIDQFFRQSGWHLGLDAEVAKLEPQCRDICQAYCDGFNHGLKYHRQWALTLAGYIPEPWTIADSILGLRMTSYLTLAQSQQEVERLFIEMAQAGFSNEKLESLFPGSGQRIDRVLIDKIQLQEPVVPKELLWNIPVPRAMASNNWVVSGDKTQSGKAIMANDPHLEVNRLPNVWYELALQWPGNTLQGFGMPGLPAVVCGRSPDLAWGVTYSFMDTVDSWVEHCRDGCYRRLQGEQEQWLPFARRTELIKRKKHDDLEIELYHHPQHGVLEGDPKTEGHYLASRWSPARSGAASIAAMVAMYQAQTSEEVMACLGQVEAGWNWVVADGNNTIGYQMSGLMPKRHPHWNGLSPAPGWLPEYDWQGFVAVEDLPRQLNPDEGFIVTANQDLNHLGNAKPINMPMGDYRAVRIAQCLAAKENLSLDDMKAIQLDIYSIQADQFLEILLASLEQQDISAPLLEQWDRKYSLDSYGAAFFEGFYQELRKVVFARQDFGEAVVDHLVEQTGVFIDFYQNFDRCLLDAESPWFADKTQQDCFIEAFNGASKKYQGQTWGELNRMSFINQMFQGKLPGFLGFDIADVPIQGGRATPHQGQIYKSAGRQTSFAPSIRMVADLSEQDLHSCLAGGPSEKRLSPWYKSEVENWLKGDYKTLKPEFV